MAPEGHGDLLVTQMLRPDVIEEENDAAMPALRGRRCRLSQYMRGQVSYRFHADGERVCARGACAVFASMPHMVAAWVMKVW